MSVDTGGPVRGLLGRWLMRIQAVQGILQLAGIAITAASTLTTALVSLGLERFAPYVLAAGVVGSPAFAYLYVEYGLFNRKNRENSDRGNNFATPRDMIDDSCIGAAVFGAVHQRPPTEEELETIVGSVQKPWSEFRNGVDIEEVGQRGAD